MSRLMGTAAMADVLRALSAAAGQRDDTRRSRIHGVRRALTIVFTCSLLNAAVVSAAPLLQITLGIRETGAVGGVIGPIGSDGGTGGASGSGGIEFVNLDGQTLIADGTWQQFIFTPATDPLTAFAGTTADSMLDGTFGVLEHIRFRSTGDPGPWTVYIDEIVNTTSAGATTITGFAGFVPGTEVVFHEPSFSGSSTTHLAPFPNSAGVTDEEAHTDGHSYKVEFGYVDDDPARWLRLTSFGDSQQLPNPLIVWSEIGAPSQPTVSFWLMAERAPVAVPEPASAALLAAGLFGGIRVIRRRRYRVPPCAVGETTGASA